MILWDNINFTCPLTVQYYTLWVSLWVSTLLHIPRTDTAMPHTVMCWDLTHIGADILFFNKSGLLLLGALWILFYLLFLCFFLRFLLLFQAPFQLTATWVQSINTVPEVQMYDIIFTIFRFQHTYNSATNWIHRGDDLKQGHIGKLDPFPRKFSQFPSRISGQTPTCCLHLNLFYL